MIFTASDVPAIRRQLAEWYKTDGAPWYELMIRAGRQPVRPDGPPRQVSEFLARAEHERVTQGDLWFVDRSMCQLVTAAHETMPAFTPHPEDLPSRTGFAVFAEPIMMRDPITEESLRETVDLMAASPGQEEIVQRVRHLMEVSEANMGTVIESLAEAGGRGDPAATLAIRANLREACGYDLNEVYSCFLSHQIEIYGVSWSHLPGGPEGTRAPAGGVWMSFYSNSNLPELMNETSISLNNMFRSARSNLPPLIVDNEAVTPWCPPGGSPEQFALPAKTHTTHGWARLVFALFRLAAQVGLGEQVTESTPRAERRRTARAQLPDRPVRVVRLRGRQSEHDSTGMGGREYRHRWIVRGHWRQQWYPTLDDHRPIWINAHAKGPDDAPLLGGERVTVVRGPQGGYPA